MRSKLLLLVLIYFLPSHSYAQAVPTCSTETFQKQILLDLETAINYVRRPNNVFETLDSNILISGRLSYSPSSNPSTVANDSGYIAKLDKQGNAIWYKTFKDTSIANARIFQLADSNYILYYSSIFINNLPAMAITKLDKHGNFVWQKIHTGNDYHINFVGDMNVVSDGGFIATGMGDNGLLVCKFDPLGNLLWYKDHEQQIVGGTFVTMNSFNRNSFVEKEDGYIIGQLYFIANSIDMESPAYILKINKTNGDVIWSKQIVEESRRLFLSGLLNSGNDIILAAGTFKETGFERGVSFYRIDKDGNLINNVNMPRPFPNFAFNKLNDGVVGVLSDTSQHTTTPYAIFQLNKDFTLDWAKRYQIDLDQSGANQSKPMVIQCKDSNLYAILSRKSLTDISTKTYFLKTDKTGSAGDCQHINFDIPLKKNNVTISDVPVMVYQYPLTTTNGTMQMNSKAVYTNTICSRTTYCDDIKITGADRVCNFSDSIQYSISRNGACFTSPVWKLADTSYGNVTVYSDASVKILFGKAGQVKLYATIPTNCGEIKDSLLINVSRPAASLNIGNNFSYCGDSSFVLQAGNGFLNYLWQDGTTAQSFTAHTAGIYHVTVTDYCNNSFRDSVVIAATLPEQIDLGNDLFICKKDSVSIAGPAGFANYTWSPAVNIVNSNTRDARVFPEADTKYYLHAEKTAGLGCISIDSVVVRIHPSLQIQLPQDTSICQGNTVLLDAGPGFLQYNWSTGDQTATIHASQTGQYSVQAVDMNGCKSRDTFRLINTFNNPVVLLSKDSVLCSGTARILDAGAGAGKTYTWQDGSNLQRYNVTDTGFYKVVVTDINKCVGSDSIRINTIAPTPTGFLGKDTSICFPASLSLSPFKNYDTYLWSNNSTAKNTSVSQPGIYWLRVIDSLHCAGTDSISIMPKNCINSIYFPNAFTPNNDGRNDLFRPSVIGTVDRFLLVVYNRYGQIVFRTENPLTGWNGSVKGALQNTGAFTWVSQFRFAGSEMEQQKGTIILIR